MVPQSPNLLISQSPNLPISQSPNPQSMEYYKSLGATDRRTDGHWLSVTLDSPQQQQQPQEKGWLKVMADPSDLGHGKNSEREGWCIHH